MEKKLKLGTLLDLDTVEIEKLSINLLNFQSIIVENKNINFFKSDKSVYSSYYNSKEHNLHYFYKITSNFYE